jgi:hypothetical protein
MLSSKSIKFHLVSKPDVNRTYLRWHTNLNVNSKSKKGHYSAKWLIQLPPPVYRLEWWWWTSVQSFKAIRQYVNGLWKYLRYNKNLNVNSKSRKGIILSKCLVQLPLSVYRLGSWWQTSVPNFKIDKYRIPKECPTRQNWKCCRLGLIKPVHERYWKVQTTVYAP